MSSKRSSNDYRELDVPDQTGKTFLVTGANTGIGFDAARVLANQNARVLLGCRSEEKAQLAIDRIQADKANADLSWIPLDLGDLKTVASAAEEVRKEDRLDGLINNAGVMVPPKTETVDGFEQQFGVNHLGHFALTGHLIEKLMTTAGSRIVNVSSLAHRAGKIDYEDIHANKNYNKMKRYQMSKFANILFTLELDRKLKAISSGLLSVACHPGVSITELTRHSVFFKFFFFMAPLMNSSAEGALPTLMAATDDMIEGGDYIGPKRMGEMRHSAQKVQVVEASKNKEDGARLWDLSEQLTGVKFLSN